MPSTAVGARYTPQQYLALERQAETKSEYRDGEIVPMPGVSRTHNRISLNLIRVIGNQLVDRPEEIYASDIRVRVGTANLYTYPDIAAVRDEPEFEDDEVDTLLNPAMILEILSPSTEAYDRGAKFASYQQLPSLQEYILIAQDAVRVERFGRRGDRWEPLILDRLDDVLRLESIGCEVTLREVYAKTAPAATAG